MMLELDVGIGFRNLGHRLAPQLRGRQHVGLVDRGDLLPAMAGRAEGDMGDPLDLGAGVGTEIGGEMRFRAASRRNRCRRSARARPGCPRPVAISARSGDTWSKSGEHLRRAEIGEQAELLAQAQQPRFRAHGASSHCRPADRAEQDRVGAAAGVERRLGQRIAVAVDRHAAEIMRLGKSRPRSQLVRQHARGSAPPRP